MKKIKAAIKNWIDIAVLILYIPLSCFAVGMIAHRMRYPGLHMKGSVFWNYSLPLPGFEGGRHIPTLIFGLSVLLMIMLWSRSTLKINLLRYIRVMLLVPMILITLFVVLLNNTAGPLNAEAVPSMNLFLFMDIDFIILFLLTFLPHFKRKTESALA